MQIKYISELDMLDERLEARNELQQDELALQNETSHLESEGMGYNFTLLDKANIFNYYTTDPHFR